LHTGRSRARPRTNEVIRPATPADVSGIAPLVERYWEFEGITGYHRPRIEALLEQLLSTPDRGAIWVADTGAGPCGYLLAVFMFSLEHGGMMAEIDEIFVLPEMRPSGIGALLLAVAERDMEARGLRRLQLQLGVENHRGRAFYFSHGFVARAGYELLDKSL
jgi:GNAT superfamily N-acetyltransferase